MKEHINKKVLNKPEYVIKVATFCLTALHTLGILSIRFMRQSPGMVFQH